MVGLEERREGERVYRRRRSIERALGGTGRRVCHSSIALGNIYYVD